MAKYVMVVQSQAKPGRDDDYNKWYDTAHIHDICAIPGVKSGKRYDLAVAPMGPPGLKYLAIYEVETDDPTKVLAEMGKRGAEGKMSMSDALDAHASVMWFYKAHD